MTSRLSDAAELEETGTKPCRAARGQPAGRRKPAAELLGKVAGQATTSGLTGEVDDRMALCVSCYKRQPTRGGMLSCGSHLVSSPA